MADFSPPDKKGRAAQRGIEKSGKVADFRYQKPSQPKGHAPPESSRKRRKRGGRPVSQQAPQDEARKSEATLPVADQKSRQYKPPCNSPPYNRPTHHRRQAYAALDLGTNNCRLLIARPSGEDFTVIDAFSRVVRLGDGLARSGKLSDDAMERTLAALHVCAEKLRKRNVHLARSVATEACRRASNGAAFIEQVRRETGIALDIISAEEEARLAVLGCHVLLESDAGPAVIFDIGGGSTELVLVEPADKIPHILDWQSVPLGVVSLTDSVDKERDSPQHRLARYREMRDLVLESFAPFSARIAEQAQQSETIRLLGTSGTVTTLASLHLRLPHYDRRAVDGLIVPSHSMRKISSDLSEKSREERSALPCIGRDRADLVVAGCAILESILDIWPAEYLGVADRGIREGILRSMMSADAQAERSLRDLKRLRSE